MNTIDDRSIVAAVRAVLEYVAAHTDPPVLPLEVSQAAFDASREAADYPSLKRGWAIARQLKITWNRLKEIALADGASANQSIAAMHERGRQRLTREEAIRSIQIVARRLGVESLRPTAYEEERKRALEEDRRHWRHKSSLRYVLLTLGQIEHLAPFAELAREAGLGEPPAIGGREGVAHLTAIAGFYDELGYLPATVEMLRQYTSAKGYSLTTRGPCRQQEHRAEQRGVRRAVDCRRRRVAG